MNNGTRLAAVRGTFYPKKCLEIESYFRKFNHKYHNISIPKKLQDITPRAAIVPHAGYMYSGYTANFAYNFLKQSRAQRIIVVGPSHHHYFKGVSGSYYEKYETPCGELEIDSAYLFAFAKKFNIGFEPKAHKKEHSAEVQMPFIEHYMPKPK